MWLLQPSWPMMGAHWRHSSIRPLKKPSYFDFSAGSCFSRVFRYLPSPLTHIKILFDFAISFHFLNSRFMGILRLWLCRFFQKVFFTTGSSSIWIQENITSKAIYRQKLLWYESNFNKSTKELNSCWVLSRFLKSKSFNFLTIFRIVESHLSSVHYCRI